MNFPPGKDHTEDVALSWCCKASRELLYFLQRQQTCKPQQIVNKDFKFVLVNLQEREDNDDLMPD